MGTGANPLTMRVWLMRCSLTFVVVGAMVPHHIMILIDPLAFRVCGRVLQIHAVPKPNKQCKQDFPGTCPTLNPDRLWGANSAAEEVP